MFAAVDQSAAHTTRRAPMRCRCGARSLLGAGVGAHHVVCTADWSTAGNLTASASVATHGSEFGGRAARLEAWKAGFVAVPTSLQILAEGSAVARGEPKGGQRPRAGTATRA